MDRGLREALECPVCLDLLADPVLLDCAHSICRACATPLVSIPQPAPEGSPALTLRCPLCREQTILPNGVASLKRNYHLGQVVEQLQAPRQPPAVPAADPAGAVGPTCGRCKEAPADSGCDACRVLYCPPCRALVHTGALAHHTFTDAASFQKRQATLICPAHDEPHKLFCPLCIQLVCMTCGVFGDHKDHGCVSLAKTADSLPPLDQAEGTLQAVVDDAAQLLAVLATARTAVEEDGAASAAQCRAFLAAVEANTRQRLALVDRQQVELLALQRQATALRAGLPAARAVILDRVNLHRLTRALAEEMGRLEVTEPPLLRLAQSGATGSPPPGLMLPTLPTPEAGEKHRCQSLALRPAPVLAFKRDCPSGLQLSSDLRRCQRTNTCWLNAGHWLLASLEEGFSAGQVQFTMRVVNPGEHLLIGVAAADAKKTGPPHHIYDGVWVQHRHGRVHGPGGLDREYGPAGCFPAGCRVAVTIDFVRGTLAFAMDGQDWGPVPCPLPPGPLHPAVCFLDAGSEVELV